MKFRIEHVFADITPADYEKLYFDEEFNEQMCKAVDLTRTLVKREIKGNHLSRVVKVAPEREIPGPIAKIIGANRLEYTEYTEYDLGSFKGSWKTVSAIMTDKVDSAGSFNFSAKGSGVQRVVDGEVKVKIFGLGGVVEKFIVADVEKSYERVTDFTRRWIAGGGKV